MVNGCYQCVFSVITSFDTERLKPIYFHAIYVFFKALFYNKQIVVKTQSLSYQAQSLHVLFFYIPLNDFPFYSPTLLTLLINMHKGKLHVSF